MEADGSLVLLSGGVESTTLLYEQRRDRVSALFFDYGQRAARQEAAAAGYHCQRLGVDLARLDARLFGRAVNGARGAGFHVPLPQRNLFLIGAALNWAAAIGVPRLLMGLTADDRATDLFARSGLEAARLLARDVAGVSLETPYLGEDKISVIRRGKRLSVDYAMTYSCLRGRRLPCGQCPQCLKREAALQSSVHNERTD